jgi:hypothetical protein
MWAKMLPVSGTFLDHPAAKFGCRQRILKVSRQNGRECSMMICLTAIAAKVLLVWLRGRDTHRVSPFVLSDQTQSAVMSARSWFRHPVAKMASRNASTRDVTVSAETSAGFPSWKSWTHKLRSSNADDALDAA